MGIFQPALWGLHGATLEFRRVGSFRTVSLVLVLCVEASLQKVNLSSNCIAARITGRSDGGNAAVPSTAFGAPSGGVFVRLKTSVRKSRLNLSLIIVLLIRAKSASCSDGPRTGLREQDLALQSTTKIASDRIGSGAMWWTCC